MPFTEKIYEPWMRETQTRKYEGVYMDFILPSMQKLRLARARVLDVGVGEGWFESFLEEKGITPKLSVGVDSTVHALHGLFVLSDGSALPFRDGTFDVVVSFDTIHLIQNVRELVRVVRKNGFLLVTDYCNPHTMEGKRTRMLKSFEGLKLLKEGVVGDEREWDYVTLFQKV